MTRLPVVIVVLASVAAAAADDRIESLAEYLRRTNHPLAPPLTAPAETARPPVRNSDSPVTGPKTTEERTAPAAEPPTPLPAVVEKAAPTPKTLPVVVAPPREKPPAPAAPRPPPAAPGETIVDPGAGGGGDWSRATVPTAHVPDLPAGAERYTPARLTQSVFRLNDRPTIDPVRIAALPNRDWHQSGGMLGVRGFKSEKYRFLPRPARAFVGLIAVKNSFGFFQRERGLVREYADGTRFDDVLLNASGAVFEHRMREKKDGLWKSKVVFSDKSARPPGYAGLKQSCGSCHDQAGTGGYAVGLVPGGDTVMSDPLPWALTGRRLEQ